MGLVALALNACVVGATQRPGRARVAAGPPPPPLPADAATLLYEETELEIPGRVVRPPPPPDRGQWVWVRGNYHWDGVQYVWLPGRWEPQNRGYLWRR